MTAESEPSPVSSQREANVAYANALMETEIAQRNERKNSQEGTARWIVASTGVVITLLLGLAKDEGVFSSSASVPARVALVATVALGGLAVFCAIGCLWPREYERLGKSLTKLNDTDFLDKPEHEVMGQVVAARIGIAGRMDDLHEAKAKWLKWSFRFLALAFVGLVAQGAVLATNPPKSASATSPSTHSSTVDSGSKAARSAHGAGSAATGPATAVP